MALLTYILALGFYHVVLGNKCVITTPQEGYERQLRKDLFECPENLIEPHSQRITVTVQFELKYFHLKSDVKELNLQSWMFLTWIDNRLKWDTDKYGGLEAIEVKSHKIWTPTFRIYNSANSYDNENYHISCTIKHTGFVLCVPMMNHVVYCNIKLADFPYDTQECKFIFGPVDHNNRFNVSFGFQAMSMEAADNGSSWFISDYREQFQVPDKILNVTMLFEREAQSLAAVILYPALILSSLSIACLFLDVRVNERLMFAFFSILCHYYWLTQISETLPKLNADPPRILLYYRGSFILTVFILLITLFLTVICRKATTPHIIVIFLNNLVYGSNLKSFVYPSCVVSDNRFNKDWTRFVNSVNSLCIIAVVFSYFCLYIIYMPK